MYLMPIKEMWVEYNMDEINSWRSNVILCVYYLPLARFMM